MPKSGLIITADDYGLNPSVNKGIRKAVSKGVVSSVHVMANLVGQNEINDLIDAIHEGGNNCGIGLHINTTWGRAIIQEDAKFKHTYGDIEGEFIYRDLNTYVHGGIIRNKIEKAKMRKEIEAQFNHLAGLIGGAENIDGISSHYNFHFWDNTYIRFVMDLAKIADIPVRSPYRWKTNKQRPKPPKYPRGTRPLTQAGLKTAKRIGATLSTLNLMRTPLSGNKLKTFYNLLGKNSITVPHNNSGHWFGQPSNDAVDWFIEKLDQLNKDTHELGYASEIYMHISDNIFGGDPRYGYSQAKRRAEYNVVTNPGFIVAFNNWKNSVGTRHGSYRKVLQGKNLDYNKIILEA